MTPEKQIKNISELRTALCDYFNVTWDDVTGPRKYEKISIVRRAYCYFGNLFFGASLSALARDIHRKSHCSAIWHVESFRAQLSQFYEPVLDCNAEILTRILYK